MNYRRRPAHLAGVFLVLAAFSVSGCVKTDHSNLPTTPFIPTTPTPPPTTSVTETFTGNLDVGGSSSFPFNVGGAGVITGTLTSLGPDSSLQVGIALGYWSGTSCTAAIPNPTANQGATVSGTVSGAGTFCVGVYDVGNLQSTMPFIITVIHP